MSQKVLEGRRSREITLREVQKGISMEGVMSPQWRGEVREMMRIPG
jgi:hypothetical protein